MSNDQQRGDKTLYDTTERIIENNQVHLRGKMVTGFSFSHELLGEGFYTAQVTVDRLSEVTDTIPIMVSERLIDVTQDYIGKYVEIRGQFRSYNQYMKNITALSSMYLQQKWRFWKRRIIR